MAGPRSLTRPIACALTCFALVGGCNRTRATADSSSPQPALPQTKEPDRRAYGPVQIEMKHVRLHAAEGIVLDIAALRGEMISRNESQPPVFDDPKSYVLKVFTADISMDMASLTHLMNDYVFAYDGSPLGDITMEIDEGRLKQKAKLHKGVPIPITLKAYVSATPDGRMRLETDKVSALGVPAKTLMQILHLELDDVVSLKNRRGIEISDNDVILSPGQIVPPPEIRGRLSKVAIAGNRLVQSFAPEGPPAKALPPRPDPAVRNYIYFSGAVVRFGRLTMSPAHLQLIDLDPSDPFDFHGPLYERQLVAGYSKNIPGGGLKTYMPDYGDLGRAKDLRPAR